MKVKIIMRATQQSEVAFWRRKAKKNDVDLDNYEFKFRAEVERDRYFAEQRKYSLKTRMKR